MVPIQYDTYRISPIPSGCTQARIIKKGGARTDHDSHILGTLFVNELLGKGRGYDYGGAVCAHAVEITICSFRPFQRDVRAMLLLQTYETLIEFAALCGKYTYGDLDARITEYLNAASCHLGVGVRAANDYAFDAFLHYQVGTRGSLSVVAAGLKTDIKRAVVHCPISIMPAALRVEETIDFGMGSAILTVPAFADNELVVALPAYKDGTHHGIGCYIILTEPRELQATVHVFAIVGFHTSKKNSIFAT